MIRGTKDLIRANQQQQPLAPGGVGNVQLVLPQRVTATKPPAPPQFSSTASNANPILKQLADDTVSPLDMVKRLTATTENASAVLGNGAPPAPVVQAAAPRRRSGGGLSDHDLVAEAPVVLDELKRKVEIQRQELDTRTDNVNAIQRNFQRLSEMYSTDRQKLIDAETEIMRLSTEIDGLRSTSKLFAALRSEYGSLESDHTRLKEQIEGERNQHVIQVKRLEEHVRTLERENKSLSSSMNKIARDLQSRATEEERMAYVVQDAETACNSMLLALLNLQEYAAQQSDRDRACADVGKGIAFLAGGGTPGSTGTVTAASVPDAETLRVEVIAKSLQGVTDAALPAIKSLMERWVKTFTVKADEERQLAVETIRVATKRAADLEWSRRLQEAQDAMKITLECSQSDTARLKSRIESLEKQIRDASVNGSTSLQAAEQQLQSLREHLSAQQKLLDEQQAEAQHREHTLKGEIARLETALQHQERDAATEVMKAASRIQEIEAKYRLESSQRAGVEQQLQASILKIKQLEADQAAMLRRFEETGKASAAQDAAKIRSLEQQLQTAKAELAVALSQQQTTQDQLNEATKRLQEAKTRADDASQTADDAAKEANRLREKLQQMDIQITTLMAERSQLLMDQHSREDDAAAHAAQIKSLQMQLSKLMNDKGQLEADNKRLQDDMQRLTKTATESTSLQSRLKQLQDDATDLKSALLNASALSQVQQEKIAHLTASLAKSEADAAESKRFANSVLSTQAAFDAQRNALEQQRLAAETRSKHLRSIQEETLKTVRKLHHVEKACESGYSCQACLQLLKDPVTCAPCGHVFCRACFESDRHNRDKKSKGSYCPECDDSSVTMIVPNKALDLLTGKFEYRCQVLGDLAALLEKDMMAPESVP